MNYWTIQTQFHERSTTGLQMNYGTVYGQLSGMWRTWKRQLISFFGVVLKDYALSVHLKKACDPIDDPDGSWINRSVC